MATYKVIQDIEAEDKILGPLTLRQFIYALITALCLYLSFLVLTKHAALLLVLFLPPALFFGFLAFPFGRDQPTEVWALAKIGFLFKPRRRIWDQSGVKQLVTITVPKKLEKIYTDGLSQTEVKSRLHALADTIDSRGWAIKNVNINMYGQPSLVTSDSDRLIDIGSIPQAVPDYEVQASDDILDERSNPVAQQFAQMMGASAQAHRQKIVDSLSTDSGQEPAKQNDTPADYWFLNQPAALGSQPRSSATFTNAQVVLPGTDSPVASASDATPAEAALVERMKHKDDAQTVSYSHLRTIQPFGSGQQASDSDRPGVGSQQSVSDPAKKPDPAIQELARNNDLNVATLARQAQKAKNMGESSDGEVIVPLR